MYSNSYQPKNWYGGLNCVRPYGRVNLGRFGQFSVMITKTKVVREKGADAKQQQGSALKPPGRGEPSGHHADDVRLICGLLATKQWQKCAQFGDTFMHVGFVGFGK